MNDSPPQPIYIQAGDSSGRNPPAAPAPMAPAPIPPPAPAPPQPAPLAPPPTYDEPKTDPLLELLTRQSQEQQYNAIGERVSAATSRAMMMYGVRRAMAGTAGSPLMA